MGFAHLTRPNLEIFRRRVAAVEAHSVRHWGTLEPAQMLAHLRGAVEISLGDVAVKDGSNIFGRTIGCALVFRVLPWPKGKIKAPEVFFPQADADIAVERQRLEAVVERFVTDAEREPGRIGVHPVFGPLTLRYWQRAHGKHFAHHFEQFGV